MSQTTLQRGRLGRRDTIFLVIVALLSVGLSAVSFYAVRQQTVMATTVDDDEPHIPLPAGPRKFQ